MSNPIWFLFAAIVAFTYPTGIEPLAFARRPWAGPAVWGGSIALFVAAAFLFYSRVRSVRVLQIGKFAFRLSAILLHGAILFVFHFPLFVWSTLRLEEVPFVDELVLLLPFLSLVGAHGWVATRADERLRGLDAAGLRNFGLRTFLGFACLPVLVMVFLQSIVLSWKPVVKLGTIYPFAAWTLMLGLVVLSLSAAPLYLRIVFRACPLPPGPKRERLEALARRAGFRSRELLLLDTGGSRISNAFIVGLHPQLRYVFFTDALYDAMSERDLECVMAHEMTHALRRHILYYLFFSLAFLIFAIFVQEFLLGARADGAVPAISSLGFAFVFWVLIFGFVSRRFETEADLVGMRLTGDRDPADPMARARRFAGALHRVAELNGVPPEAGSWRHFSIAHRSILVLQAEAMPEFGLRWERTCAALRTACLGALLFSLVYGAFLVAKQLRRVPEAKREWERVERAMEGWRLLQAGRPAEAVPLLEEGARHPHATGELWLVLAEAYDAVDRPNDASVARRKAAEIGVSDPRMRLRVSR